MPIKRQAFLRRLNLNPDCELIVLIEEASILLIKAKSKDRFIFHRDAVKKAFYSIYDAIPSDQKTPIRRADGFLDLHLNCLANAFCLLELGHKEQAIALLNAQCNSLQAVEHLAHGKALLRVQNDYRDRCLTNNP